MSQVKLLNNLSWLGALGFVGVFLVTNEMTATHAPRYATVHNRFEAACLLLMSLA